MMRTSKLNNWSQNENDKVFQNLRELLSSSSKKLYSETGKFQIDNKINCCKFVRANRKFRENQIISKLTSGFHDHLIFFLVFLYPCFFFFFFFFFASSKLTLEQMPPPLRLHKPNDTIVLNNRS